MKTALVLGLVLILATAITQAQVPTPPLPAPNFPAFKSAATVAVACNQGLAGARQRVKRLEARRIDAVWLAAYDDLSTYVEDVALPIDFVLNVHPDKAVRDAAQACTQRWADFQSSLGQNARLYRALRRAPAADAIDAEFVRLAAARFEDAGVALPARQRVRAKQILDRLSALDQQFNQNIRDAGVRVAFSEAELNGVPASVWAQAPRDAQGRIVLGVDAPSYGPVLQAAENGATRERMWWARVNEGGDANLALLGQITRLRGEYALLFGFANYVDFNLRRRMAKDGATVSRFLDSVTQAVRTRERAELAELRAAKALHLGSPLEATPVQRWDTAFYAERLRRERFQVDQAAFRRYFPPEPTLAFTMRILERMLGLRFSRVQNPLWHPDAQTFVIADAASGAAIAQLYVDLYPRDGKYNHAAVWPLRGTATRIGRTPSAALVVNFDRQGLTLDEVETLLHELGHAVHATLAQTRYAQQAGISVMHDFGEAPSQMLEDWVYDKRVLKLMQEVCPSCSPVPDALIDQAVAARDFGKASEFGRQHLFASYDLALHSAALPEPMALWAQLEGATPLGHVAGSKFPAGFSHLAGEYGAGYYGYLWSLVVAMDLRTAFAADKLSPEVGRRYRQQVLGQGSQKPAPALVLDFLGRESNSQAFFEDLMK